MSTLRETVTRVVAEMRKAGVGYYLAPVRASGWAQELDAAVKADAEDVCEWTDAGRLGQDRGCCKPGCLSRETLTTWRLEWFTSQGWRYCPHCGRKIKVTL